MKKRRKKKTIQTVFRLRSVEGGVGIQPVLSVVQADLIHNTKSVSSAVIYFLSTVSGANDSLSRQRSV